MIPFKNLIISFIAATAITVTGHDACAEEKSAVAAESGKHHRQGG